LLFLNTSPSTYSSIFFFFCSYCCSFLPSTGSYSAIASIRS
jgi:hypothetical protein